MTLARNIYEDEHFLVALKPTLMLACPFNETKFSLLSSLLCRHSFKAGVAHRLDYGTHGLIICYKTPSARACLLYQFYSKGLIKKYVSLVILSTNLRADFTSACHSTNISTFYTTALKFELLDHKLIVGKRHQIRLIQRRICGDRVYCERAFLYGVWLCLISSLRYQCLTSYVSCLCCVHTASFVVFECALQSLLRYVLINFLKFSAVCV